MSDTKISALAQNTAPLGSDMSVMVDDPGGAPVTQRIYNGDNHLLPDGWMWNGKISVSVSSNNLIVSLLSKDGVTPSTTNPVSVYINGTLRRVTAALSVTVFAGSSSCNAGSAELATKEIDYFVYLGYNATDGVTIGFSRIPYATLGSDFGAINANGEKTIQVNPWVNFAAGDNYVVIGRFAATLSAGAGYTWSVPTPFTAANLIQRPIYETRWLSWLPQLVGFSGSPTNAGSYKINREVMLIDTLVSGTSNSTSFTWTLPLAPVLNAVYYIFRGVDNGGGLSSLAGYTNGGITVTNYKDVVGNGWTASGTKEMRIHDVIKIV